MTEELKIKIAVISFVLWGLFIFSLFCRHIYMFVRYTYWRYYNRPRIGEIVQCSCGEFVRVTRFDRQIECSKHHCRHRNDFWYINSEYWFYTYKRISQKDKARLL